MSDMVDTLTHRMAEFQQQARHAGEPIRHARMRAGVLERVGARPAAPPARRWWVWSGAMAAVAAAAVAVVLVWGALRPRSLTFEVEGAVAGDRSQALFIASEGEPLALSFSDGSAVKIEPRAQLRVAALREHGADLVLESGAARVHVEPGESTSWTVGAGPYRVEVVGTTFAVKWAPQDEVFELQMQEGRVRVHGPRIDGVREVGTGERLVILGATAGRSSTPAADGSEASSVDASEPVPEPVPELEPEPVLEQTEAEVAALAEVERPRKGGRHSRRDRQSRTPLTPGEAADDWRSLARQGAYGRAVEAAEAVGFSSLCRSLPAAALLELADASRYAQRSSRAREALTTLRRRFAGTDAAATAAFDLGRLGAGCDSARWFRTYLRERPGGSMASAARKRLDECPVDQGAAPSP
ncbi:MAG: FecR domain-containing protein [Myxococcota bacterium]